MPILEFNGARIAYDTAGDHHTAMPILFIHAGVADRTMWDGQWAVFAERYRVVRLDTRGFGETVTQDVPYSNRDDVRALMDHLGIARAILIGCSRGGQIALDTAIETPDRVGALVVIGSGPGGYEPQSLPDDYALEEVIEHEMEQAEAAEEIEKVIELDIRLWYIGPRREPAQVSSAFLDRARPMLHRNYTHLHEGGKPIILDPPSAGRLAGVVIPVLVLVGTEDSRYALAAADYMAQTLPQARKIVIDDAAHLPSMEHPDRVNADILSFLMAL